MVVGAVLRMVERVLYDRVAGAGYLLYWVGAFDDNWIDTCILCECRC